MSSVRFTLVVLCCAACFAAASQLRWQNVDSVYGPLPAGIHVYKTTDSLGGKPNIAYYVEVDLKDRKNVFETQVGYGKRLTPSQYYEQENHPLLVMNATFFEFVHNSNLNLVINQGKMLALNQHDHPLRGRDTLTYAHVFPSALGISASREADVAWTFADTGMNRPLAMQRPRPPLRDSLREMNLAEARIAAGDALKEWPVETAFGGGPVLVQEGRRAITNNEERRFGGKAIDDRHPRTAAGYTGTGKLILLAVEGRNPGIAEGATLPQLADMLIDLRCVEALNLDGGGSSCLLINGKETIKPSDKGGQRPVPAVFMVKRK